MTTNLRSFFITLAAFIFLWQVTAVGAKAAPRLYLEPSSGDFNVNDSFDVSVMIDTNNEEAMATDVVISFDQNKLEVNQVNPGDFFSGFDYNLEASNGKLTIFSFSEQTLVTNSGVGEIAVINFKAVAEGTATVSFLCEEGVEADSSIWDADGNDIIDCAASGSGSYQIGGSQEDEEEEDEEEQVEEDNGEEDSAPEEPTPTPSELPDAGVNAPLIIAGFSGIIMLLLSTLLAL